LCGYDVTEVPVSARGVLEARTVAAAMDESAAALMVTNPNTLGLFEEEIEAIAAAVHARGGLVYMDGANMNALVGVAKPGDMGVDVMQFNLHKTFSTPHGGGGPGAGPVAVRACLADYLPVPRLVRRGGAASRGGGGRVAGPGGSRACPADSLPVPRLVRRGETLAWSDEFPKSVGRV